MFVHNIDPVLLYLGPLQIRYYGVLYALGFLIGYWYMKREAKKNSWQVDVDSLFTYLIIGTVVGARVFEILFYNFNYYVLHLWEVVAVWKGGLSFHGGLVGGFFAAWLFCKKYRFSFWQLADTLSLPLAFALFLGRLGNFINGELYGYPTSLPWGVNFGDGVARHPTQIYESLKNLFIFCILVVVKKYKYGKYQQGFLFFLFLLLYGGIRFFIEFLKVPEASWWLLTVGQWLSLVMLALGSIGIYMLRKKSE